MSAPKHTPGPWRFDGEIDAVVSSAGQLRRSALMGDYRGVIIASLVESHGGRGARPEAAPEATANAALIAAAPDLLAACEIALKDSRSAPRGKGLSDDVADILADAIAKARGGAA